MGDYLQQQRKLRVTTPLGENELLLKSFSGSEGISKLFSYRLEMIAQNRTKVPFGAILGQKVTIHLQLPDESETHLNGLCVRFAQSGRDATFTSYEAEVVPDAWKLTRKAQSRIFQHLTVPEILKKVFAGLDADWQLNERYEPRDYCVQYRESDFGFGARLMEEEGIYYFFEHTDGGHKMIVSDSVLDHPDLPGENQLIYEELEGGTRDENRIWEWKKEQEMRPGKYVLWDHCFELPNKHLEAEAMTLDSVPVGEETHRLKVAGVDAMELYDYPGEYARRFDGITSGGGDQPGELQKIFLAGERTVELRMDEETTSAIVIRAKSNVKHVRSGYRFALRRHFNGDGEYVVTGVRHEATFGADYRSGKEAILTYGNDLTCIPVALPYRPARTTPKPVVQGSQTAVVVGPAGEEIFTDKYGRVKVQFHWDRDGQDDEESSCWIRVGTSWAGRTWGEIRIPRIGHEVIVDFLEGDPDRPIIVGSVYNADLMPPWDLPANKTRSGIKSRSSMGAGPANFNEIQFEDKKGSELLKIHAERNQAISVEANESHSVGHDRTKSVNNDETVSVGRDRTQTVGQNEALTVGQDRTVTIGVNESRTVGAAEVVMIGGFYNLAVGGALAVSVGGNSAENVGGDSSTQVGRSASVTAGQTLSLTAADQVQIQAGDAGIILKKDGSITIKGKDLNLVASGKVRIKADGSVAIKARKISGN